MTTRSPSTDDAFEAQVRATLAAAAPDDTQVGPGLADLHARLAAGATADAPPRLDPGRRTRRILAVAAIVALLVGLGAVLVNRSSDGDQVHSGPAVPEATGWYIPEGLSADWRLRNVIDDRQDVEAGGGRCPCHRSVWTDESAPVRFEGDASRAAVRIVQTRTDAPDASDLFSEVPKDDLIPGIDLGDGATATGAAGNADPASGLRRDPFVAWQRDGVRTVVSGTGLSTRRVIDAAHGVVDRPGGPPLEGFELVDDVDVPEDLASYTAVRVVLENTDTGALVAYELVPPGFDALDPSAVPTVVDLPGAPGPVLRAASTLVSGGRDPALAYLGRWPGASVTMDPSAVSRGGPGPVSDDDVREVLGSLRPATAAEWAVFVDGAALPEESASDRVRVASLHDLTTSRGGSAQPDDQTTVASDPNDPKATDLTFRPVLSSRLCEPGGVGEALPGADGSVCFQLGPVAADGTDLRDATATEQQGWVVEVEAEPGARAALNKMFNACYEGVATCPPESPGGRGSVAVVWMGRVVSAPVVNGADLADDGFVLTGDLSEADARAMADAIDAG